MHQCYPTDMLVPRILHLFAGKNHSFWLPTYEICSKTMQLMLLESTQIAFYFGEEKVK